MNAITESNIPAAISCRPGTAKSWLRAILDQARQFRQRRLSEAALSALSPDQLRDIGVNSSEIPGKPVVEVDAWMMTYLMSMR